MANVDKPVNVREGEIGFCDSLAGEEMCRIRCSGF